MAAARAGERLGAMQRKLRAAFRCYSSSESSRSAPSPCCRPGAATTVGAGALRVEAAMFALMTAALTLTLGVVVQLWRPRGSAYSVDAALAVMVEGLEDEPNARRAAIRSSPADLPPAPKVPVLPCRGRRRGGGKLVCKLERAGSCQVDHIQAASSRARVRVESRGDLRLHAARPGRAEDKAPSTP